VGYVVQAIPSRKRLLLLLAERRSSDPAIRLNDILGLQENAMLLLPFLFISEAEQF
jgi:hypothetical protein